MFPCFKMHPVNRGGGRPLFPSLNPPLVDADIVEEDSGNYTCEVRGPQSKVLRNVTHYVYVRSNYSQYSHCRYRSFCHCSLIFLFL